MRVNTFHMAVLPFVALLALCSVGAAEEVRHLNSVEAARLATAKPQPSYPPMAKQLHLEGRVEVEASIDETGAVTGVHAVSGNPVLSNAAVEALKRWHFGNMPTKAVATVDFVFKQ